MFVPKNFLRIEDFQAQRELSSEVLTIDYADISFNTEKYNI